VRVAPEAARAKPSWWVYGYSLLYLALLFVAMAADRQLFGA
jgi:heme O synthase-like polyprenyltransferase